MAILWAMLLTSCVSPKVEYIEKPVVPEIVFPAFPALESAERNADGTVTVNGEWVLRLAEYKIRIEETEKTYSDLKALYESDYSRE